MTIDTELLRMGVVYLHLIACCVALGTVIMSDMAMVRRLMKGEDTTRDNDHLTGLQKTVLRSLYVLWLTGIMLVGFDVWMKGWVVLQNPKLQAKIAIVVLLTINGVALHTFVMPMLERVSCILHLKHTHRQLAAFSGAVSGVSWLYAAGLGIGRPLNWKYSLTEILIAYPFIIAGAFVTMTALMAWAGRRKAVSAR